MCCILIDLFIQIKWEENKVIVQVVTLAVLLGGGVLALLCPKKSFLASIFGTVSLVAGAILGLTSIAAEAITSYYTLRIAAIFQVPVFLLGIAAALYSPGYLAGHGEKRASFYYFFLNLTIASMYCVTLTKEPLLFLFAWEIMGLASAALVMFDYHSEQVRKAAYLYFAACHAGAALLILFFLFPYPGALPLILVFAGFGLKIGFPLLHVWLPEAHPAAPAPVSAIMSGAMIELGFLGLFVFYPEPVSGGYFSFGWIFLVLGIIGALWGIISALPQNNLKRLLAYSSMENMGIISMAFGLATLGYSYELPQMGFAAACGGFLHIVNHAFLKGGLFLGAGAVLKSCGTLEMDKMGGLLKRTPHTGTLFVLNSAGICGLPPFNGFVSEFLIYYAAFKGLMYGNAALQTASAVALIALALTGGIATAVFAKAVGGVFLGEPRSKESAEATEVTFMMRFSMYMLFVFSIVMIFAAPFAVKLFGKGVDPKLVMIMTKVSAVSLCCMLLTVLLLLLQKVFCRGGERKSPTWDCGYARPDARMEYTATAFSQPLADLFDGILRIRKSLKKPEGIFPEKAQYSEETEDGGMKGFWKPVASFIIRIAEKCHSLQSGNLHSYIFIIILALSAMLLYAMLKK